MPNNTHHNDGSIVANCHRCSGLVRVASDVPSETGVRCPHCQANYSISDILTQSIPFLEIVGSDVGVSPEGDSKPKYEPVTEKEDGRFVVPEILAKNAQSSKLKNSQARAARRGRSNSSAKRNVTRGQGQNTNSSTQEPDESRSDRQASDRERGRAIGRSGRSNARNPVLDIVMIGLGACLSLPVAQLLIWWFLGSDPIGLAPRTSEIAPFLVPIELRASDDSDPKTSITKDEVDESTSSKSPLSGN